MNYIVNNRYGKFGGSISYYIKVVFNKTFYFFLILLSVFILIQQKKEAVIINKIKNSIFFIAQPQISIIRTVDNIINKFNDTIMYFSYLKNENKNLNKENLDLKIELLKLNILKDENQELKNILNFTAKNGITNYTIKKINILNKNDFINRAKIGVNNNDKIRENDLAMDGNGNLVGRIINVSEKYAEILLLTDSVSKIPARLAESKIKVLLEGNESKNLKINFFLGEKFNMKNNEKVYTSNDGEVLQDGISIGKIVKNKNDEFVVEISTNLGNIGYVVILHDNIE